MTYILKTKTNHRKAEIKIQLKAINDKIDKMIVANSYVTQPKHYQTLQRLHSTLRNELEAI